MQPMKIYLTNLFPISSIAMYWLYREGQTLSTVYIQGYPVIHSKPLHRKIMWIMPGI